MLAAVAETLVLYYLGRGLGVSANEIPHISVGIPVGL